MGYFQDIFQKQVREYSKILEEITGEGFNFDNKLPWPLVISGELEIILPAVKDIINLKYSFNKGEVPFQNQGVSIDARNLSKKDKKNIEIHNKAKGVYEKGDVIINSKEEQLVVNEGRRKEKNRWEKKNLALLMNTIALWQFQNTDNNVALKNYVGAVYKQNVHEQVPNTINSILTGGQMLFLAEKVLEGLPDDKKKETEYGLKEINKVLSLGFKTALLRKSYLSTIKKTGEVVGYSTDLKLTDLIKTELDVGKVLGSLHGMDPSDIDFRKKISNYEGSIRPDIVLGTTLGSHRALNLSGLAARVGYQLSRDLYDAGVPQVEIITNMPKTIEEVGMKHYEHLIPKNS